MIILDTNVVSETMRPRPEPTVMAWLAAQPIQTLCLTTLTIAELLAGVEMMPPGKRRQRVAAALDELQVAYHGRILPFDSNAARHYGRLAAATRGAGHGFPIPDGYIAGIAASLGYAVASRDASPFEAAGLDVIDPWSA
jgi:toxin FitB